MQLKKLLSNTAFWTINKELANDIGLHETIILQHFVDLQSSHFKDGGFYQQQDRIINDLPVTIDILRKSVKKLVSIGFITVEKRGIPAKNHYTVNEGNIMSYLSSITSSLPETPLDVYQKDDKASTRGTTNTKNKNSKNKNSKSIDVPSQEDIDKGKLFFKLVDHYPKNKIGNRQHGLKKFKKLSMDECKLTLINLKRYLETAQGYNLSLQNYIDHEAWTEGYLKSKEEETKKQNNKETDTKTFNGNYDNIT